MTHVDLHEVDRLVARLGGDRHRAIVLLQALQERFGYLPREALAHLCDTTELTPAQVTSLGRFHDQFRHTPAGRHRVSVCHGTACHVAGAPALSDALREHLGLRDGEDTDPEGRCTVERVACLGCCSLAPVVRLDRSVHGHLTPERLPVVLERHLRGDAVRESSPTTTAAGLEVRLGLGSCCVASGSQAVQQVLERAGATVRSGACVGMCHRVPLLEVTGRDGQRTTYGEVTPRVARRILTRHAVPAGWRGTARRLLDLLLEDEAWEPVTRHAIAPEDPGACAFLGKQRQLVLEGRGQLDPLDLAEYEALGGYEGLRRARELPPDEVIATIKAAGLRGRGGAGYPTGQKWASVQRQPGPRHMVLNGDEGDPGAFMDRMLLESYPHRVLEGLLIAAHAVGARQGYLYIRAEYPLALERVGAVLAQARERGHLRDEELRLEVRPGAGAFVCGEETALVQSLMGERGTPRLRPPYPAEAGLWGQPTCVNNVETLATVPWILREGPEAFRALGTDRSPGTKVFALAGRVRRGGLIEVPMGITLGEIVMEIGGGIREDRAFKAVQIGGPSGGCLPARLQDVRVDFEELTRHGAMMGSGGLVVMDDRTCMVDMARYFLQFTQAESCGRCTFCRVGTRRLLELLTRLCAGEGKARDLQQLENLSSQVQRTSLCGLGRSAPNPVLTTLRYFPEEYEAHLQGHCPAGRCPALTTFAVTEACIGCTLCAQHCPADAIEIRPHQRHEIDLDRCTRCGRCEEICPTRAIHRG